MAVNSEEESEGEEAGLCYGLGSIPSRMFRLGCDGSVSVEGLG